MDTELLKTFLEVSRTRHFGRAAETLYLTQSAVSSRIRQLETQLGVSLFTRHRNNIQLTDAGERLVPHAEKLMNTWLLAKKDVLNSHQHRELSIGAAPLLWETWLAEWLRRVYQQNPLIQLEARIGQRQTHVRQLHERTLDLLITTEQPKMEEFLAQKLGEFPLRLFAASGGPREQLPFVRLDWGADFTALESEWINDGSRPVLITSSIALATRIMAQTGGQAFLPQHIGEGITSLKKEGKVQLMRPIYAVWLHNSDREAEITQLLSVPLPIEAIKGD